MTSGRAGAARNRSAATAWLPALGPPGSRARSNIRSRDTVRHQPRVGTAQHRWTAIDGVAMPGTRETGGQADARGRKVSSRTQKPGVAVCFFQPVRAYSVRMKTERHSAGQMAVQSTTELLARQSMAVSRHGVRSLIEQVWPRGVKKTSFRDAVRSMRYAATPSR